MAQPTAHDLETAKWLSDVSQHGTIPKTPEEFLTEAIEMNAASRKRLAAPARSSRRAEVPIQGGLYHIEEGVE